MPTVHLLDYVAGNVRSLANAIEKVGFSIEWVKNPQEIENVDVSIFNNAVGNTLTPANRQCELFGKRLRVSIYSV